MAELIWGPEEQPSPANRPPNVDWPRRLREPFGGGAGLWAPVFGEVLDAAALLQRITNPGGPPEVLAPEMTVAALERAIAANAGAGRLFLYRPEEVAVADIAGEFTALHVGPGQPLTDLSATGPDPVELIQPGGPPPACVTAVIDGGCGFAHERFRDANGHSRIAAYWKQGTDLMRPGAAGVVRPGLFLDGAEIDGLIADHGEHEEALYAEVERRLPRPDRPDGLPSPGLRQTMRRLVTHGTLVMDLAAGGAEGPILGVELPPHATATTSGARVEIFALMGLMQAIDWADRWPDGQGGTVAVPLVANLSYALAAGPKDGTDFFETEVAALLAARRARHPGVETRVVLAAGNFHRSRLHGRAEVAPGDREEVRWMVQPADQAPAYLELRLPDTPARVTLHPPKGEPLVLDFSGPLPPHRAATFRGRLAARVYPMAEGAGRVLTLAVSPTQDFRSGAGTTPAGAWRVQVQNTGGAAFEFRVDVQRDDSPDGHPQLGGQSYLDHPEVGQYDPETADYSAPGGPISRAGTISALATAADEGILVVGAARRVYEPEPARAARYASAAATGAAPPPQLSALAEDGAVLSGRLVAGTYSGGAALSGGTSVSAPLVTRRAVELIAAGQPVTTAALLSPAAPGAADERLGEGVLPDVIPPGRAGRVSVA